MLKAGWEIKYLEDVCDKIQDGSHYSPQHLYAEPAFDRYPYLTSKNIRNGYMKLDEIQYCTSDFHNGIYPRCNPVYGDVLLTKDGSNTGNVCLNTLHEPFSLLSSVCLLKPDRSKLIPEFLVYYIRSDAGFSQIMGKMTGAAIKRIILKTIKKSEIPLPPLPEQTRIVAILDEAFANISQAVANAEKNLANARELFDSYLNEVFTRKGEGWEEKSISEITSQLGDGLHGTPEYTEMGEYYFINGNNLSDGTIEIKENTKRINAAEYHKYKKNLNDRTILVSINGTLGNVAFFNKEKVILGKSACYFNLLNNVDKKYIKHVFSSSLFLEYAHKVATGATIKNVSLKSMREFRINLPPIDEQKNIVKKIDFIKVNIEELEDVYRRKLAALAELKQALLQKAFTGELTAADQPT